mgnify:CR=1 FL=1
MKILPVILSQFIIRVPPGKLTFMSVSFFAYPFSTAATTVAHAPVPHASVKPQPLSQTIRSISVSDTNCANSTLVLLGKALWVSIAGP